MIDDTDLWPVDLKLSFIEENLKVFQADIFNMLRSQLWYENMFFFVNHSISEAIVYIYVFN